MKNTLAIVMVMTLIVMGTAVTNSFGQQMAPTAEPDTALAYTETVNINGVAKDALFIRARDWFSNNLQRLNIQDKETGELSGAGRLDGPITIHLLGARSGTATFTFLLNIWVKDGRYKYVITNINNADVNGTNTNGVFGPLYTSRHCMVKGLGLSQSKLDEAYQSAKDGFDQEVKLLIAALKASMAVESTPDF
jgi:Domain of unknown function (DUF4468) with TBP-like fold